MNDGMQDMGDEQLIELICLAQDITVSEMAEALPWLAAIGIVVKAWRNTELENWHGESAGPGDYDMFITNAGLTQDVHRIIIESHPDLDELEELLTSPDRQTGRGTALEVCGPAWEGVRSNAAATVAETRELVSRHGRSAAMLRMAGPAIFYASYWWGTPIWERKVASYVRAQRDTDPDLAGRLIDAPLGITEEEFTEHVLALRYWPYSDLGNWSNRQLDSFEQSDRY